MNLFALTTHPADRILRFPLSHDLQQLLTPIFRAQRDAFLQGVAETIEFDGRYKPEKGELLAIRNYVDVNGLAAAVHSPVAVAPFDPAVHSLDAVKAIFTGCPDGSPLVLVQLFEQRRVLAAKNIAIFFSGNTFQSMSNTGLTLDNKLLAVLDGKELKFQSFHFLRRVFDLKVHFKEATAAEVKAFAAHEKFAAADQENFEEAANSTTRRKIVFILQSGVLDRHPVEHIVAIARMFKVDVQVTTDGKIQLPTHPQDLRRLLRFLDEDYYESPLSRTHYVSNSKRVAD